MREQLRQFRLGVIGAIGAACILASASASNAQLTGPVVTTTGTYQGLMNFKEQPGDPASGVNVFFGIRYGQAPTGTLRWKPPQAPNPGQGSIIAGTPGHTCVQGRPTDSEDCLFLNVYTPSNATAKSKLPVFIWIHGGALVNGAGSDYDPSVMVADNDIIVVTINYRLGSLGFLAAAVLEATAPSAFENVGDAGNYGFMDQQFAMAWVQNNIAAFGGDPTNVTIGGESAGGLSVSSHLASTNTFRGLTGRDLFGGAIIESGAYMYHDVPSLATYQALSDKFVKADAANNVCPNSVATLACLQGLPVAQVFHSEPLFGGFGIAPNFGTKILPLDLHTAFSTGQMNHVPVLQGTNANEGRLFEPSFFPTVLTFPFGTPATIFAAGGPASFDLQKPNILCASPQFSSNIAPCTYLQEIQFFLQTLVTATPSNQVAASPFTEAVVAHSATAENQYPITNFHNFVPPTPGSPLNNNFLGGNVDEALSQIFTDFVFACNGFDSNSDLSNQVPVFAYEFNDPNAPTLGAPGVPGPGANGSGFTTASQHAAELQYIFNFGANFTSAQATLATQMKTYWANFVKTGNPNNGGNATLVSLKASRDQLPFWKHFNTEDFQVQSLTPAALLTPQGPNPFNTFSAQHFCASWEPLLTFNNGNEPQQP